MTVFQASILGLIQGLTEFLPVSSSAHLVLAPWIFKWQDPGLAFDVFLHMGTLCAIGIYFFRDLLGLAKAGFQSIIERRIGFERDRMLFWMIVIGTVPGALAGALLHKHAEELFRSPLLIAATLAFVGFLIYWVDGQYPFLKRFEELSFSDAVMIGIAQAFSIVPGVSRSGSTIAMGRKLGFNREAAARFSFLLCFPIILGAGLMEGRHLLNEIGDGMQWDFLIAGFSASFISGLAAIHFMLTFLRSADLAIFFWYRLALSIFVVIWSFTSQS